MRTDCERRSSCGVCKNRYGITYNKTLLREHGWELPNSFAELEVLAAKAKKAGMDENLSKPVDISALEQAVKRFRVTPPIIASQEISATFKQHICEMQFNVVAVALKS